MHALQTLDLDSLEKEQRDVIVAKKKTARPRAVRLLNIIEGLRKNELNPTDMMLHHVPVIPPKFRPFSITGNTFLPGDANELYKDLIEYRRLYERTAKELGAENAGEVYADMNRAAKAAYGYGESPNPKTKARAVKGFFETVVGTSPKTSIYQSKMLSKPVDSVGRGVVVPDADLGMDEVGIPESMAWKLYGNYIQRRLVQSGMSPSSALRHVKERTPQALKALESEMPNRPVVMTRSPAWFKFNAIGQTPHIVKGDSIKVNTYITEGLNMDFDGDTASIHLPSSKAAVKDVDEKMRPSVMLWSTKNRGSTYHNPKHEQLIGLSMGQDAGGKLRRFSTEDEAMRAIEEGQVDLNDDIEVGS
jgi:DNA-directed RNA polymerase subunit beta'